MPYRGWKHRCSALGNNEVIGAREVCESCGTYGEYVGWQSSMHDAMALYEQFYELAAVGPHRPYADQLFCKAITACGLCRGSGLLDADGGESRFYCPVCDGLGRVLVCRTDEFVALREQVLAKYPRAGRRGMILLEPLPSPPWKDNDRAD